MSGELWECQTCHRTGELDEHGRCDRCGSDQVIPLAKVLLSLQTCEQENQHGYSNTKQTGSAGAD